MAEDPKLTAEPRNRLGSLEARRLRRLSRVPGNVYGHGQDPVAVSVAEETLTPIVMSGHKVVDLDFGGSTEKAMFREIQWDTFGAHLIHFDLQRVSADERVHTEVAIETHGTSPGVVAGGILEMPLHTLKIECPAISIPERIHVNLNNIELGGFVRVRDLQLPAEIKVLHDGDEVVLHVVTAADESVETDALPTGEPELVNKKAEDAGE